MTRPRWTNSLLSSLPRKPRPKINDIANPASMLSSDQRGAKLFQMPEFAVENLNRMQRPMTANTSFLRSVVCNVEGYNAYTSGGSNSDMKVGEMREDPAKDCKEEYKKSLKKRSSSRESRRQTGHSGRDEKQEHKKNEKEKHKKRKTSSKCLTVPPLMNFTQKRGNVKVMIVDWAQVRRILLNVPFF